MENIGMTVGITKGNQRESFVVSGEMKISSPYSLEFSTASEKSNQYFSETVRDGKRFSTYQQQ